MVWNLVRDANDQKEKELLLEENLKLFNQYHHASASIDAENRVKQWLLEADSEPSEKNNPKCTIMSRVKCSLSTFCLFPYFTQQHQSQCDLEFYKSKSFGSPSFHSEI